ncbi:hypothetical protein UFOVP797_12 [uncultured Caudovirales phage]|uniref:Uncharacterized protein n=1 Tax=uncultured Caudovirales phage TaxID=2100421 RepID=A0A6J5NZF1_9CAUD|nr:hypothetical protein UFOVP797_12 [uncultured Caudovirales phage]
MSRQEWAANLGIFVTLATICTAMLRFYVKAILHELIPNSGNSLRDRIDIIETRQMHIHDLLLENALNK